MNLHKLLIVRMNKSTASMLGLRDFGAMRERYLSGNYGKGGFVIKSTIVIHQPSHHSMTFQLMVSMSITPALWGTLKK